VSRKRSIHALLFCLLAAVASQSISAPFGPETQVGPSFRQWSAYGSRLGLDYNLAGAGVAVWNDSNPATHASDRIFGQRLQVDGMPVGGAFVVNASDGDEVEDASVGIDAQGNLVAVWTRSLASGRSSVRARRFNAQGVAQGGEIVVHSDTNSAHYDPAIVVRPDGSFIVTWSSGVLDGSGDVFVRRFSATGVPAAPETIVNTNTSYSQVNPAIALAGDGGFAIVWQAQGIRLGWDIAYRVFDSAGIPASDEILVNSDFYYGDQRNPAIGRNASGRTAIAWDCYACDASDWGVRARIFDAAGAPVAAEFVVNHHIADDQVSPALAVDADGKVLLVWSSEHYAERRNSIVGRYFSADATPISVEFRISQESTPDTTIRPQVNAVARIDPNGLHRVGWTGVRAEPGRNGAYLARAFSVDAGPDQTISAGVPTVELSGSTYAGAAITAWQWSQLAGPEVVLQNADQATARFVPPLQTASLTFQLSVQYADGSQSDDLTQVHLDVDAPQAHAGMDQMIAEGEPVSLSGSGTANNGGVIASYSWQQISGPAVLLADPSSASTSFVAPQVTADSIVSFRLTVSDDQAQTGTDDVDILVLNVNQAPLADFSVSVDYLTAHFVDASSDPDGTVVSRSWNFGDGGSSVNVNPSYTFATAGTYLVTLKVTDDQGAVHESSRQVTVTAPPANLAPVANFSFNVTHATASFVDASSDPDGSIATRLWAFGDGSSSTAINPTKTFAAAGTYAVTLTVTDNRGASAQIVRNVTVTSPPPPENELQNAVARTNLSGTRGSERRYTMVVPAGASGLSFQMSGGTGDADLYVRYGSAPTTTLYDCRPYSGGNTETCNVSNVRAGTYHVMIRAYSNYSGTQLIGRYQVSAPAVGGGD
jgi:PKD repeat protein